MIAEYLSFNGYEHTLSVFAAETSSSQSQRAASITTGGGNGGGVGVRLGCADDSLKQLCVLATCPNSWHILFHRVRQGLPESSVSNKPCYCEY
mmetsp:Transcript_14966/g.35949  ORF Transcript_14966/g.35949 Transcript_14966/m.35949 type:complete len:93 (+) Transcript_14966:3-281(+)